ncbi:MAG: ribosomal protein S18-alanine N-acetyltransferase [Oscillospiraceae bacterium]|nr:ribosomal protein S18-alanine N-acetyltransferase [Oscillospiraceae bacterium]
MKQSEHSKIKPNPQQPIIVPATTKNLPQILEIGKESISADWTLGFLLADINKEDTYIIAAMHGEEALGFAVFREVGDDGELLQIATHKDARCSGVGSVLLENVLQYAQRKSLHKVFLEVRKSNTPAIRLYEKFGFNEIRTRRAYYDNPIEDALVMERTTH